MEHDVLAANRARARFYIKHHAPLGIDYAHKGNIYDFASQEALQATLQDAHADVLAADENSMAGQRDALESMSDSLFELDNDEKTPTVHFSADFFNRLTDDHD